MAECIALKNEANHLKLQANKEDQIYPISFNPRNDSSHPANFSLMQIYKRIFLKTQSVNLRGNEFFATWYPRTTRRNSNLWGLSESPFRERFWIWHHQRSNTRKNSSPENTRWKLFLFGECVSLPATLHEQQEERDTAVKYAWDQLADWTLHLSEINFHNYHLQDLHFWGVGCIALFNLTGGKHSRFILFKSARCCFISVVVSCIRLVACAGELRVFSSFYFWSVQAKVFAQLCWNCWSFKFPSVEISCSLKHKSDSTPRKTLWRFHSGFDIIRMLLFVQKFVDADICFYNVKIFEMEKFLKNSTVSRTPRI